MKLISILGFVVIPVYFNYIISVGGFSFVTTCGGFIPVNQTFDLIYEIPALNKTNETRQDSSTCVWVISTGIARSIGFNLTRLDLNNSMSNSSLVSGILSVQQGIRLHPNDTIPLVIDNKDVGREIVVNETWTLLVFRHFSLDARVRGRGFQLTLRPLNFTRFSKDKSNIGVETYFFGKGATNDNVSQSFIFPTTFGQPCLAVVNSVHGQGLELNVWTFFLRGQEFANLYKFSKEKNRFVYATTLVYMIASKEYYGTVQSNEDQPILFYFHTRANLTGPVKDKSTGMLHLSYMYKTLTNISNKSIVSLSMVKPLTTISPTVTIPVSIGTTTTTVKPAKLINVTRKEFIFVWVFMGFISLVGSVKLGIFVTKKYREYRAGANSMSYSRQSDELDNVSLVQAENLYAF